MKRSIFLGCRAILATSLVIFGLNYDLVRSEPTEVMDAQYKQVDKLKEVPGETKNNLQVERAFFGD